MLTSRQIFFGTPHRATTSNAWGKIISRIVFDSSSELPGAWFPEFVEKCAKYHEELSTDFVSTVGRYRVLSCYEISDSPTNITAVGSLYFIPLLWLTSLVNLG